MAEKFMNSNTLSKFLKLTQNTKTGFEEKVFLMKTQAILKTNSSD